MTRGHLCRKQDADRSGFGAESCNLLNACPQSAQFNSGIWLQLENWADAAANAFGRIWIVDGPIFRLPFSNVERIGDPGELPVWVPDEFWKVVIREPQQGKISLVCFMFDHRKDKDGKPWRSILDGRGQPLRHPTIPPF